MAADRSFVDTNVLAYAHDRSETVKQPIARSLIERLWDDQLGVLSTQVLQELYVVATRKFAPPMPSQAARDLLVLYATWEVVQVDVGMILAASELESAESISFWDALIVEAAKRAGATQLLTEDLQAGRRFDGLVVVNPFQ